MDINLQQRKSGEPIYHTSNKTLRYIGKSLKGRGSWMHSILLDPLSLQVRELLKNTMICSLGFPSWSVLSSRSQLFSQVCKSCTGHEQVMSKEVQFNTGLNYKIQLKKKVLILTISKT